MIPEYHEIVRFPNEVDTKTLPGIRTECPFFGILWKLCLPKHLDMTQQVNFVEDLNPTISSRFHHQLKKNISSGGPGFAKAIMFAKIPDNIAYNAIFHCVKRPVLVKTTQRSSTNLFISFFIVVL